MPKTGEVDSAGRMYWSAPDLGTCSETSAVNGVWLHPHEEVEWVWTHGPNGSYVSGYNIKSRLSNNKYIFSGGKA